MWLFYVIGSIVALLVLSVLVGKLLNRRHKGYPLIDQAVKDGVDRQQKILSYLESAAIDHLLKGKTVKVVGSKIELVTLNFENVPRRTSARDYALTLIEEAKKKVGEVTRIDLIERNYRA